MSKVDREKFIVRLMVKDRDGIDRRISLSPVLFTTAVVLGRKQKIPVKGETIIRQLAARLTPDDSGGKSSFSRMVQDELVLCIVELLGGEQLKDEIIQEVYQAELGLSGR